MNSSMMNDCFNNLKECFKNLEKCFSYLSSMYPDNHVDMNQDIKIATRLPHDYTRENTTWTSRTAFYEIFNVPVSKEKDRDVVLNFKKFDNIIHKRCETSMIFNEKMDFNDVFWTASDYDAENGTDVCGFINMIHNAS